MGRTMVQPDFCDMWVTEVEDILEYSTLCWSSLIMNSLHSYFEHIITARVIFENHYCVDGMRIIDIFYRCCLTLLLYLLHILHVFLYCCKTNCFFDEYKHCMFFMHFCFCFVFLSFHSFLCCSFLSSFLCLWGRLCVCIS